jgi:hypothetical protein
VAAEEVTPPVDALLVSSGPTPSINFEYPQDFVSEEMVIWEWESGDFRGCELQVESGTSGQDAAPAVFMIASCP